MMRLLHFLNFVELELIHRAAWIETGFRSRAHHLALAVEHKKIFPERPRGTRAHTLCQFFDALLDNSGFFFLAAICLAVGFEATSLIEMKKCASQFIRRQCSVQCFCADRIRVENFKTFAS